MENECFQILECLSNNVILACEIIFHACKHLVILVNYFWATNDIKCFVSLAPFYCISTNINLFYESHILSTWKHCVNGSFHLPDKLCNKKKVTEYVIFELNYLHEIKELKYNYISEWKGKYKLIFFSKEKLNCSV